MDRKTALAAAAAVTMAVAGGVSGLFLTVGSGASASTTGLQAEQPTVTVEYVDQDGNPIADPASTPAEAAPGPNENQEHDDYQDGAYQDGDEDQYEDHEDGGDDDGGDDDD